MSVAARERQVASFAPSLACPVEVLVPGCALLGVMVSARRRGGAVTNDEQAPVLGGGGRENAVAGSPAQETQARGR
jgi:hypothetical protein